MITALTSAVAWYLMDHDSKAGFVSGLYANGKLWHELGNWDSTHREKPSNGREAENLT